RSPSRRFWQRAGGILAVTLLCPPAGPDPRSARRAAELDPKSIRFATWNIHKEGDAGWEEDLRALAANSDILLLQETTLEPAIQDILRTTDLGWVMASSFGFGQRDIGVLTAARVEPVELGRE